MYLYTLQFADPLHYRAKTNLPSVEANFPGRRNLLNKEVLWRGTSSAFALFDHKLFSAFAASSTMHAGISNPSVT